MVLPRTARRTPCEIHFGGKPVLSGNPYSVVTNPILEMGILYCRVMLEFLGIKYEATTRRLIQRAGRHPTDTIIENFGRPQVTIKQLKAAGSGSPRSIERACKTTIRVGHTAVAHLTHRATPRYR